MITINDEKGISTFRLSLTPTKTLALTLALAFALVQSEPYLALILNLTLPMIEVCKGKILWWRVLSQLIINAMKTIAGLLRSEA